MTINGLQVGADTMNRGFTMVSTGTRIVENPANGLMGTVTVVLNFSNSFDKTGTLRIDSFTLNGYVEQIPDTGHDPVTTTDGKGYRFGFNGQERDIENGNDSYVAQYWEYDSRIGRRWNADPLDFHSVSLYSVLNNSPLFYVDPDGLYSTRERAEKMRARAIERGKTVGQVTFRAKQKDWIFTETVVTSRINGEGQNETIVKYIRHSETRFFGMPWQKLEDLVKDLNPFKNAEVYIGGVLKTDMVTPKGKVSVPFGGFQVSGTYEGGKFDGRADIITGTQMFGSYSYGKFDVRAMPLNGIGGDYQPGVRVLYTIIRRPILVPVGEIPVPIGEWKLQGDGSMNIKQGKVGIRAAAESVPIPSFKLGKSGFKFELNAGIRFELQMPDILKK